MYNLCIIGYYISLKYFFLLLFLSLEVLYTFFFNCWIYPQKVLQYAFSAFLPEIQMYRPEYFRYYLTTRISLKEQVKFPTAILVFQKVNSFQQNGRMYI